MNPRNVVTLIGYFPDQDKMGKSAGYREGSKDKKSFYYGKINVKRAFKDADGNNKYDWIRFKAFGSSADFIHNYVDQSGSDIIAITGELQVDDNYEDKDGNTVYGQPYVLAEQVAIVSSGNGKGTSHGDTAKKETPVKKHISPLDKLRKKQRNVVKD